MRPISSSRLPRHSHTSHLRALYHDPDDADAELRQPLHGYSALDSSQLETSKSDSDRSSQHSAASNESIDHDQPYYALMAHLTRSPHPQPTNTTSNTEPSPNLTTATLPAPLWPIACDIFDQASRLHRTSHPPSPPTSTSPGAESFSFLNLLTAHTDVTGSLALTAVSTSLLFSFLVALHRLSLQLGEERVDWWRLLQAAWVRQCRTDEELRCDETVRWRLENERRLTAAVNDGVDEVKEASESGVVQRQRQRVQVVDEVQQSQPRQLQVAHLLAPAGRKRKYDPLSSAAVEMLKLHFHSWRSYAVDQRIAPDLVLQAETRYCQTVWQRWRTARLLHKADRLRADAERQLLRHAVRAWTQRWQRRKLSNAARRLAKRHHQLFTQSLHLSRWTAALHDARDERHQLQIAVQHHKQLHLPTAVQRWQQYASIRHKLHSDASTAAAWRRKRLAREALAVWQLRLGGAFDYQKDAAVRLRPLRLRHAVSRWQRIAKAAGSAVVSSGPFLHTAFRWLHLSFDHPLPFVATAEPSSRLAVRPSRQRSHCAMQRMWRQWQLQRVHAAWRAVVAQHKAERVKLSHCQRLSARHLLQTAWQQWQAERARKEKRRRRLLQLAIVRWREQAQTRKTTREQFHTAALVHMFNTQRCAFHVWAELWLRGKQQRQEADRQIAAQQQRDEHERLMEEQMQQHAASFHHHRILSSCLVQWHSYAVHSLAATCTLTLAASHHSSVCKQWALQRWRQWQHHRKQRQAELQLLGDRADVMYVGRLLSVMLVCWRVQLARKQTLRVMQERREQRALRARWQRWLTYVQICQQERREQRAAEERQKREDDARKGQLIVALRLQAVWSVWRNRMAVIAVGQQLTEKRRQHRQQRVMSGWWEALRRKRQLAQDRRLNFQQLMYAYLKRRQNADNQRLRTELVASQQGRRRRLAAVFAGWKDSGLRRLDEKKHVAARDGLLMAGRVLHEWRTTVLRRTAQRSEAVDVVERKAAAALLAAAFHQWLHALYFRSLYAELHGRMDEDSADTQLVAFALWRRRCMSEAWQLWSTESVERRLHSRAEKQFHGVAISRVLAQWSRTARHANQQRQFATLSHHNDQRRAFAQWRQALALQRQERRATESLQSTLTATSLPFVRPLLLSVLRPSLSSVLVVEWFGRWRTYVAHRRQRLEMTTAAYQLYHHNLLAAAFAVMRSEYRMAAQTASFAHSLVRHRLSTALHHWHSHTTHRQTIHTLTSLTTSHYSSRLATTALSAWRQQCQRGAARRARCAEVERGVDALVVRSAFVRWRRGVMGVRRRQQMFVMGHSWWQWKWQALRLRERRQLLLADSQSNVAGTNQAVAVDVG